MKHIRIRHNVPVWEQTFLVVELDDDEADIILSGDQEAVDALLIAGIESGKATVQVTGQIESMDGDYEITEL